MLYEVITLAQALLEWHDGLPPEFINRLDELVVFHPLQRSQIRAIANIQIGYLRKRNNFV